MDSISQKSRQSSHLFLFSIINTDIYGLMTNIFPLKKLTFYYKEKIKLIILFILFPLIAFAQNIDALKKAELFYAKSQDDSAIVYFEKGFYNCANCKTIKMANYFLNYANIIKINGKTDIALQYILKAESIFSKSKNYEGIVKTKLVQAELYRFIGEEIKGINILKEAKKIIDAHPIRAKIRAIYYDRKIALTPKTEKTAPELIELCNIALPLAKETNDYKLQFSILNEMGYTYTFSKKEKYKAEEKYKEALQIAKKHSLEYETCDVLFTLGIYTIKNAIALKKENKIKESLQKFDEYKSYHEEALKIANKLNYLIKQRDITYYLYISYRDFQQYKPAMEYCQTAYKYEIKRLEQSKEKEIAEVEGQYISEKKDLQIKQNKLKIQKQYFGLFFLLIGLITLFYFFKKAKDAKNNIQLQKNKIEEISNQKTVLLKEIHHRVKNNLQVISSLLYLQANRYDLPEIKKMVNDSHKHINAIALVHEMLYNNDDLELIFMQKYLEELGTKILQISVNKKIKYRVEANNISLPLDCATSLGLILNELLSNSLKHAFVDKKSGNISVSLQEIASNNYQFTYQDNGIGMDLNETNKKSTSLGVKLIKMFAEEMDADLKIESNNGLSYTLFFKKIHK